MKLKPFILFLSLLFTTGLFAQEISPEVVSTAGSNLISSSVSLEWTLGEISIKTLQGETNILTQGFHQPEYSVTNISEPVAGIDFQVYPNPTSGILQITIAFERERAVVARLTDVNGKLLWNKEYYGQHISDITSLQELPNGSYFLNFSFENDKSKQTFKILKTN